MLYATLLSTLSDLSLNLCFLRNQCSMSRTLIRTLPTKRLRIQLSPTLLYRRPYRTSSEVSLITQRMNISARVLATLVQSEEKKKTAEYVINHRNLGSKTLGRSESRLSSYLYLQCLPVPLPSILLKIFGISSLDNCQSERYHNLIGKFESFTV